MDAKEVAQRMSAEETSRRPEIQLVGVILISFIASASISRESSFLTTQRGERLALTASIFIGNSSAMVGVASSI